MPFARFAVVFLASIGAASAWCAPLKLCYDDVPQSPWTMPGETGLNIELLKRVEKLLGEQFVFTSRPWKRCLEEVRHGVVDAMVGAADSTERRRFAALPVLPGGPPDPEQSLYSDHFIVFTRKGSGASWDGKQFLNLQGDVVVQRGYIVADDLRARGHKVNDSIKSPQDGLRMLAADAADAAVLLGVEAEEKMAASQYYRSRIEQAELVFTSVPLYLMFNQKTYAANPQRIERIWQGIREVRASASYQKREATVSKVRHSHKR